MPKQPKSGKCLKGDLQAALTEHIQNVRPTEFLLEMLPPDHNSSRERAPPIKPKSKPKVLTPWPRHADPDLQHLVPHWSPHALKDPLCGSITTMDMPDEHKRRVIRVLSCRADHALCT